MLILSKVSKSTSNLIQSYTEWVPALISSHCCVVFRQGDFSDYLRKGQMCRGNDVIYCVFTLRHTFSALWNNFTLKKNRADILAIGMKGQCVILTATPSWHGFLLECPVKRSVQGLPNGSRWLYTVDQTILFAGPIMRFSNAWPLRLLCIWACKWLKKKKIFVSYLLKTDRMKSLIKRE